MVDAPLRIANVGLPKMRGIHLVGLPCSRAAKRMQAARAHQAMVDARDKAYADSLAARAASLKLNASKH